MKQILLLLFLICGISPAFSQTGKLTGSVKDSASRAVLERATISVLQADSTVIAYQLADKNGLFQFSKLPLKKKLLVSATYAGYIGFYTSIQLEEGKTDTLELILTLSNNDSLGVVVSSGPPVRMNGDTLEINPAAFKTKSDAVVEELLNQVSGITIWSDGTITVNGKEVNSVLVDGKPFMGSSDPRIATQNLPKSAIDKIQLYQEFDRSKIGQPVQPRDSLLTMNIKLKETSKKGFFGKAGAGYGTSSRFESDLSFQVYNKKSSAGIGGGFNNINKNIGSLQEMFQNNTYRNMNPNLYNTGRFGASGINRNYSGGISLVHNFTESANSRQNNRAVVNYTRSGTDLNLTDLNLQNRTTTSNPQFIRDEGVQSNQQNRQDLGINYNKTNTYNDNLNLVTNFSTSTDDGRSNRNTEVRDASDQLLSTNATTSRQHRTSSNESLNLSLAKGNSDEPAKNFFLQLNTRAGNSRSERYVTSHFNSLTDPAQNTDINRRYNNSNQSLNITGTLDYTGFKRMLLGRYNLFGIFLNFTNWFSYDRNSDNTAVGDYESSTASYIRNSSLSNNNKREKTEYTPSLSLSKFFYKYRESGYHGFQIQLKLSDELKSEKNQSSFIQRNLNRSFQFFHYDGSASFQQQKKEKYRYFGSLNYFRSFEYPSVDRLYSLVDSINVYDIRIGNPDLKNSITQTLNTNMNYSTQDPKAKFMASASLNGNYSVTSDPVTDSIINELSGKRSNYYINADRTENRSLNYNFNLSRKMKKSELQLMYSGNLRDTRSSNYIDALRNTSKTFGISNLITLQYSMNTALIITLQQSFQYNKSRFSLPGLNSFSNNGSTTRLGIVLNLPANISISSTADRVINSNVEKPIVLWNTFMSCRVMKQQGEIKFSAMDLLKQYQNISNSVSAYGTSTRITNGLQQYFLLTFSYFPRKFGNTAAGKPKK